MGVGAPDSGCQGQARTLHVRPEPTVFQQLAGLWVIALPPVCSFGSSNTIVTRFLQYVPSLKYVRWVRLS